MLNLLRGAFGDAMECLQDIWVVPFIGISLRAQTSLVRVCCATAVSLMNEAAYDFVVNLTSAGTTVSQPCF